MTFSEAVSTAGVLVTLLTICATVWAAIHQAKKSWLIGAATLTTALVDKFNTQVWGEHRRVKFVKLLLKPDDDPHRTLIGNYGFGVLGFYEHIGYLVRCGALDKMMIHNKFAWELVCYYQLVRQGPTLQGRDLLTEMRKHQSDKTQYMEFAYLNDEMIKLYRHLGTDPYAPTGRIRWMDDFIAQESTLLIEAAA